MSFLFLAKLSPSDALAISMLIVIAFTFGALFSLFLVMARNGRKAQEEEDVFEGLFDEDEKEEPKPQSWADQVTEKKRGQAKLQLEAWEKEPDWWKQN